jgi:hypothetical protein
MLRETAIRIWLLALLCALLLSARAGGAHLHLCFDGSEPPVSFHAFDIGMHHDEPQNADPHQDRDVGVLGQVLAKLLTLDLDLPPALVAAVIALFLVPAARILPRSTAPGAALDAAPFLRPPLRGPPAASSR